MKTKKLIPLPKLKAKAVIVFNNYIRTRDRDLGCISCGGRVDHAGHYLSAGQHSALKFHEHNVNGQCVGCNNFRHGNSIYYRMGLVEKIGEVAVKELEQEARDNNIKKWSRTELEEIINRYGTQKRRA